MRKCDEVSLVFHFGTPRISLLQKNRLELYTNTLKIDKEGYIVSVLQW